MDEPQNSNRYSIYFAVVLAAGMSMFTWIMSQHGQQVRQDHAIQDLEKDVQKNTTGTENRFTRDNGDKMRARLVEAEKRLIRLEVKQENKNGNANR